MRITSIRNINTKNIYDKTKSGFKNAKQKLPKKVTINNLPVAAGAVGLMTPIPFAGIAMYALAKAIQILAKKFLHKP